MCTSHAHMRIIRAYQKTVKCCHSVGIALYEFHTHKYCNKSHCLVFIMLRPGKSCADKLHFVRVAHGPLG